MWRTNKSFTAKIVKFLVPNITYSCNNGCLTILCIIEQLTLFKHLNKWWTVLVLMLQICDITFQLHLAFIYLINISPKFVSIWQKQLKATNALIKRLDQMNIYCWVTYLQAHIWKCTRLRLEKMFNKNVHNAKDSEMEWFWQFLF